MFCIKCGKQIADGSKFCPYCGAAINENANTGNRSAAQPVRNNAPKTGFAQQAYAKAPKQKKPADPKMKMILFIVLGVVVAALVAFILLKILIKPTIDLDQYTTVEYDGYDSIGEASVNFDFDAFEEDYETVLSRRLNEKKVPEEYKLDLSASASASDYLYSSFITYSIDKSENLSNGDNVVVKWKCNDQEVLNEFGVKLKYSDIKSQASGLEKAEKFDPFEDFSITYEGMAPNATAQFMQTEQLSQYGLSIVIDKADGLSNGDKITATLTDATGSKDDVVNTCIKEFQKIPSATTKEYTVSGLSSLVTKLSDIPDKTLKEMQAQAVDEYKSYVVNYYSDSASLDAITYLGTYLLTAKNMQQYGAKNELYLVYKITTGISQEKTWVYDAFSGSFDSYWYIEYSDLVLASDNNIDYDVTKYNTPSPSVDIELGDGKWRGYVRGYQSLNALRTAVVTGNASDYSCEEKIDENAAKTSASSGNTSQSGEDADADSGDAVTEIFPDSSTKLLTESDVEDLDKEDLRFAINEPYARHGYIFKDQGLQDHFDQFDWYDGTESDDKIVYKEFNDIEKKNIELMQKKRDELK